MSAYVQSPLFPFVLHVTDAGVDDTAIAVKHWVKQGDVLNLGIVLEGSAVANHRLVLDCRLLGSASISEEDPRTNPEDIKSKPMFSYSIVDMLRTTMSDD
jgi:hypothetical protein